LVKSCDREFMARREAPDAVSEIMTGTAKRSPSESGRLLAELGQPGTYGFACHFGDQAFGRVIRDQSGLPAWEPVAAGVLRPPPRRVD
jgi:hypothetical protein